ncbi:hypothetical protein [Clostridium beijerinckii]|uniref:Uncharacterized protein n=1 Tax=Clostridium beijerinckii TaxID=1520 RepID=A0AAX0AXN6_CLOBE|nr:hypothetical protein [Clostridium beijerinckii]NRT87857.1 hypothetical protein [Clostridium beijerinckii]NYC02998.1 hypothetical protein [Clostridium beijerinckii]NYC73286.1 hypothetical protein [Clostridium beijerinckii]
MYRNLLELPVLIREFIIFYVRSLYIGRENMKLKLVILIFNEEAGGFRR